VGHTQAHSKPLFDGIYDSCFNNPALDALMHLRYGL